MGSRVTVNPWGSPPKFHDDPWLFSGLSRLLSTSYRPERRYRNSTFEYVVPGAATPVSRSPYICSTLQKDVTHGHAHNNEWLAKRFEEHRSHLTAVAYRMLGSLAEADDAVQGHLAAAQPSRCGRRRQPRWLADHGCRAFVFEQAAFAQGSSRGSARSASTRSRGATPVSFDELISQSDYLMVQAPLTPATRNLMGEAQLRRMRPSAILVNTARGPIVNDRALCKALKEGWIAGAGLDDLEEEPAKLRDWKPTNPLFGLDNVIITPHAVYYSEESIRTVRNFAAQEVVRVLSGNAPLSPVNADKLASAYPARSG